jgi:hypothetical protein
MSDRITIKGETLQQLRSLGDLNSTEEQIIMNLISHVKCCDRFWENRFD